MIPPNNGALYFSYGSNSISQLRARVENPNLVAYPGKLENWCRIFRSEVGVWDGGGTASIVPIVGHEVYGAVVCLTHDEVTRLDCFEFGYSKVKLKAQVLVNNKWTHRDDVTAYIADDDTYIVPPSESYLTAIHTMLKEQHPESIHARIPIYAKHRDGVALQCEWKYESPHSLSLSALLVLVNAHRTEKWIMPKTMNIIIDKLREVHIIHPLQILNQPNGAVDILDEEAIAILKSLLSS